MFVQASPDAPPAEAERARQLRCGSRSPAADLVIQGSITLFTNKAFKSKTDFISIDAGTYTFDVKTSGTPTVLASAHNVLLAAGKIYTLYVRGFAGSVETTALDTGLLVHN